MRVLQCFYLPWVLFFWGADKLINIFNKDLSSRVEEAFE